MLERAPGRNYRDHLTENLSKMPNAPRPLSAVGPLKRGLSRRARSTTPAVIADHLEKLGAGNHVDNLQSISGFRNYFEKELTRDEFLNLVFLHNQTVAPIVSVSDRRLKTVAQAALNDSSKSLGPNWDLEQLRKRF